MTTKSPVINYLQMSRQNIHKIIQTKQKEIEEAEAAEVQLIEQERAQVRSELEQLASASGFSVSELFPVKQSKGKRHFSKTVKPQYQNPDNPAETWTGLGRKSNWLVAKLKDGAKLTEFKIGQTPPASKVTKRKKKYKSKPRYANPDDPSQTWTGMGRPPAWMQAKMKGGVTKTKFLI